MNFRRYTLFLLVAILTFFIGVTSAVIIGKVSPFSRAYESRGGCRRLNAQPGAKRSWAVYTVYRSDGTIIRANDDDKTYDGLEKLAAPPDAATAPPPPPVVRDAPRATR